MTDSENGSLMAMQRAQAPLVGSIQRGELSRIPELFATRVRVWPHPVQHDECFTVGLFGDLSLPPDKAFEAIPLAVRLAVESTTVPVFECALVLLEHLVLLSATTEVADALLDARKVLAVRARQSAQADDRWRSIVRHLRMA